MPKITVTNPRGISEEDRVVLERINPWITNNAKALGNASNFRWQLTATNGNQRDYELSKISDSSVVLKETIGYLAKIDEIEFVALLKIERKKVRVNLGSLTLRLVILVYSICFVF